MCCLQKFGDSHTYNEESWCQFSSACVAALSHPCNAEQPQSNGKKMGGQDLAGRNIVSNMRKVATPSEVVNQPAER